MNRIKEFRESFGLTQTELAKKINTSQKNISRWEKNENEIGETSLLLLADFFQISIDELVGRTNIIGITEIKNELSTDENKLLTDFRACPAAEQRVLLDYADMLYSRVEKEKKKAE